MYTFLRSFLPPLPASIILTLWYIVLLTALILLVDHAPAGDFRYGQL